MNTKKTTKPMFKDFPEIKVVPWVGNERLMDIIARYQEGDTEAEQQLKDVNMFFVANVARHYINKGLTNEKLIKAGTEGLLTAAGKFDPKKDFRFISYAVWWIKRYILLALKESGSEEGVALCNEYEERQSKYKELDEMLCKGPITEEVRTAIETLDLEEMKILLFSFGFGFIPLTDKYICQKLGLTQQQLSKKRNLVILKMREKLLKISSNRETIPAQNI